MLLRFNPWLVIVVMASLFFSCSPSMRIKRSIDRIHRLTAIYPELADTFKLKAPIKVTLKQVHVTHSFKPEYEIKYPVSPLVINNTDTLRTPYFVLKDTTYNLEFPLQIRVNDSLYVDSLYIQLSIFSGKLILQGSIDPVSISYHLDKTTYDYQLYVPFWKDMWFWIFILTTFVMLVMAVIVILQKVL